MNLIIKIYYVFIFNAQHTFIKYALNLFLCFMNFEYVFT